VRRVDVRCAQCGVLVEEFPDVRRPALGDVLAGLLVGIGGERVELLADGVAGVVPQHVRVGLARSRSEDPRHHRDQGSVGVGHLRGRGRGELGRQVGR
jgi:hypothetical protein